MKTNLKMSEPEANFDDFAQADQLREQTIATFAELEAFYSSKLTAFPDQLDFEQAHHRGRIMGMQWQTRQLQSLSSLFYSQAGQDHFLDQHVFQGKRNGFFVEIGGYDGVSGSNCLFFESIRGWSGLMIEPAPGPLSHARLFRTCECLQVAVGPNNGEQEFLHVMDGYDQMSGLLSGFMSHELDLIRSNARHKEEIIKVPTCSLADLLKARNIKDVDYCSVDIEGSELQVLREFPFQDFNVSVWSIENNRNTTDIAELMMKNGYELFSVLGMDELYVRKRI